MTSKAEPNNFKRGCEKWIIWLFFLTAPWKELYISADLQNESHGVCSVVRDSQQNATLATPLNPQNTSPKQPT